LGAAATGGMIVAGAAAETLAQGQPPFGPTPPPLAGAELPSFRFALGAITPKSWDGGWAKEATVAEFPVSEKLAGVLMSLVPGALRELHWHANAAEWAYMIKGQCRVTTIDPHGHCEIVGFGPGDIFSACPKARSRIFPRASASCRGEHVPMRLDQPGQHDHVVAGDDLRARRIDVPPYRDDLAVARMHGPARNISERGVHGHDMCITEDELAARGKSRCPDIAGRPRHVLHLGEER
jgi:hypothetical protein